MYERYKYTWSPFVTLDWGKFVEMSDVSPDGFGPYFKITDSSYNGKEEVLDSVILNKGEAFDLMVSLINELA
jgi:hypothetical protein